MAKKEKVQKDKQRSTKHTHKTQDRVTRTPLITGGELRCSTRVSSSCSTRGTRRKTLFSEGNFPMRAPANIFNKKVYESISIINKGQSEFIRMQKVAIYQIA